MQVTKDEPVPTMQRESRWMVAYHFWGGVCLFAMIRVLFERQSIVLGALPAVLIVGLGYVGSRALVGSISRSRLSPVWKVVWKWILPIAYLPLAVVLAFIIGNAIREF